MHLEPGTALGPYAVTAKIGQGGMGEVYPHPRPRALSVGDRRTLAEIGRWLGRQALAEITNIVRPRRSSPGTGGSSGESSLVRNIEPILDGPESVKTLSN